MKKYAAVPYILKAKRFKKEVSKPCLKNHAVFTVGLCKDDTAEPTHEAHIDAEFTVTLLDIVKFAAITAGITAAMSALVRIIVSMCRNDG